MFAPKGTPKPIVARLNAAASEALTDPVARRRLIELGQEIFPKEEQSAESLAALQKADIEKWWPIIKSLNIKPE